MEEGWSPFWMKLFSDRSPILLPHIKPGVKVISLLMVHPDHIGDPSILEKACYCLANLAVDNPDNIEDIIHGGALKSVLACMERYPQNPELMDSGSMVIGNLCDPSGDKTEKNLVASELLPVFGANLGGADCVFSPSLDVYRRGRSCGNSGVDNVAASW